MNKSKASLIGIAFSIMTLGAAVAAEPNTHAGKAVDHAAKSFSNASGSVVHSIAASGQLTSAASAIPLSIGASVGAASGQLAHDSMKAATAPIGTPLPVTDEVLTTIPPNEALKVKKDEKSDNKL